MPLSLGGARRRGAGPVLSTSPVPPLRLRRDLKMSPHKPLEEALAPGMGDDPSWCPNVPPIPLVAYNQGAFCSARPPRRKARRDDGPGAPRRGACPGDGGWTHPDPRTCAKTPAKPVAHMWATGAPITHSSARARPRAPCTTGASLSWRRLSPPAGGRQTAPRKSSAGGLTSCAALARLARIATGCPTEISCASAQPPS